MRQHVVILIDTRSLCTTVVSLASTDSIAESLANVLKSSVSPSSRPFQVCWTAAAPTAPELGIGHIHNNGDESRLITC
jgi:hypothetical protein